MKVKTEVPNPDESLKAVNREIALPVDHILESTTAVLARYLGHDPQMAEHLLRIIDQARLIKQNIHHMRANKP